MSIYILFRRQQFIFIKFPVRTMIGKDVDIFYFTFGLVLVRFLPGEVRLNGID